MGIQTLLLIKERKKEKDICCFVIKRAKKTHKKEKLYTYKNTRTNTRVLLHTYICTMYNLPICMSENQIMRRHNKCLSWVIQYSRHPFLHMCIKLIERDNNCLYITHPRVASSPSSIIYMLWLKRVSGKSDAYLFWVKKKRFKKVAWIWSHHFHLQWKFKQQQATFCLYTSNKISCP